MGARDLIAALRADGFTIRLTETGIGIRPSERLTAGHRTAIRQDRNEVIDVLQEEESVRSSLRAAIDRCCDARGDDDGNRALLQAECAGLPTEQQADLLAHFIEEAQRYTL